jgi:hypothetical protein
MAKYVLEEYVFNGYNASSKAREDVSKIVLEAGFKAFATNDKRGSNNTMIKKVFSAGAIYLKLLLKLGKDDLIFLQTSEVVLQGISKVKKIKQFKVIYLIHDLFSVRYDDIEMHSAEIIKDVALLNQCDYIICHNEHMKEKLIEMGVVSKLYTIELFDYLITDKNICIDRKMSSPGTISFAGNLEKSTFLTKLDEISSCQYDIYGKPPQEFVHMNYKGSVAAACLPNVLKGNFGLIWEGDYQITEKDNYTRFNNPHKLSLYIVAGIPVIIWKKSARSDFVEQEGIGLCIDNLDQLDGAVASVDENSYKEMVSNCMRIRKKLMKGAYLKDVLRIIDKDYEEECNR